MTLFHQVLTEIVPKALLCLLIYAIAVCTHKVTFHPLSKYPGPFLAKFTDAYAAYHAWKGDIHLDMWRCHEKYGKFVRYSPNRLNVNSAAGIKDIYSSSSNVKKSKNYGAMVHQALNTLTVRDKKDHGRRRRVISQGFSDAAVRNYEPSMLVLINRLCDRLLRPIGEDVEHQPGEWHSARNMAQWCNYAAFDIMADLIFAGKYNLLERDQYRYVVNAIETSNVRVGALLQAPILRFARLDKMLFPKSIYARDLFVRFVGKLLRDTLRADNCGRKNLFNTLSTIVDPVSGSRFKQEEIVSESTTLVVAGADTVATAMSALLFYLSRNPTAYARAADEVRRTFSSLEDIHSGPALASCIYLRACVDEAMRMSPSVGSTLYREVSEGGAIVDGEALPAGVDVGTPIYAIQHHPDHFFEPFKYMPERWIVGEGGVTREAVDKCLNAYLPFSTGPRGCVGKGMAISEMMLTTATLLYRLDFKSADGDLSGGKVGAEYGRHRPDEFQLKDHVTSSKIGPILHFRERDF